MAESRDLTPSRLSDCGTGSDGLPGWLTESYVRVEGLTVDAINWYIRRKRVAARWSRLMRSLAIILGTVGAIVPLWAQVTGVPLSLGYIFLVLAGGLIAMDKLLGLSSSWMRYVQSELQLQGMLLAFQLKWTGQAVFDGDSEEDGGNLHHGLLGLLVEFSSQVSEVVQKETNLWALEFTDALTSKLEFPGAERSANSSSAGLPAT